MLFQHSFSNAKLFDLIQTSFGSKKTDNQEKDAFENKVDRVQLRNHKTQCY